uniref:Uncharacterized protein n=1 Tax=Solanum lycopersicum TaxID=4081 RepID=A0A3Q7EWW2_SOLLC
MLSFSLMVCVHSSMQNYYVIFNFFFLIDNTIVERSIMIECLSSASFFRQVCRKEFGILNDTSKLKKSNFYKILLSSAFNTHFLKNYLGKNVSNLYKKKYFFLLIFYIYVYKLDTCAARLVMGVVESVKNNRVINSIYFKLLLKSLLHLVSLLLPSLRSHIISLFGLSKKSFDTSTSLKIRNKTWLRDLHNLKSTLLYFLTCKIFSFIFEGTLKDKETTF